MQLDPLKDPAVQALSAEATGAVAQAAEFHITNAEQRESAAQECIRLNSIAARLEAKRKEITDPLEKAKKAVMDLFRPWGEQLGSAVTGLKRAMGAYDDEQERIRIEQQREAEAAAQRERDRLQREANERQAEADRKAAEERQAAEAARSAGNIAEAEKHERKANQVEQRATERVEVLQDRAGTVVAPVLAAPAAAPKVAGVSGRIIWKWRVKSESAIPREYLVRDDKKIGGVVRAMGKDTNIPGIEVYPERDYNVSRRGAA